MLLIMLSKNIQTIFVVLGLLFTNSILASDRIPIAPVFGLKTSEPIGDFRDVTDLIEIVSVTTFLLDTPKGEYWITSSQLKSDLDRSFYEGLRWQYYVIYPSDLLGEWTVSSELIEIFKNNGVEIGINKFEEDPVLGNLPLGMGVDFVKVKREIGLKNGSTVDSLQALHLRDLNTHPLEFGEPLTIEGIRDHQLIKTHCTAIGYDGQELVTTGRLALVMDCPNTPTVIHGGEVELSMGGVSGGPIRDAQGNVVGIFTGSLGLSSLKENHWFLVGTPLFNDYAGKLRPYPFPDPMEDRSVILECFNFYGELGFSIEEIIGNPSPFRLNCEVSNSGENLQFKLRR